MITAKEARERVESSAAKNQQRWEKIGAMVEIEADLGKNELTLYPHHDPVYQVSDQPYRQADFTPVQRIIKSGLEQLGYRVAIESFESDASKGFGSMESEPRIVTSYYIVVRW